MLFFIILLGFLLRFIFLINRGTFWFDELFSVHFSSLPWKEALQMWTLETNPPFHTFFLRYFIKIFSDSEIIVRSTSLFFALISIFLLYKLALHLFDKKTALFASTLLALSGTHIFVSTEARAYSLIFMLSIFSFFLFYTIFYKENFKKNYFYIFSIVQTLLFLSHLTILLVPIIQFLSLASFQKKKENLLLFLKAHIFPILLFFIWFVPSVLAKWNLSTFNGWFFNYDTKMANIFTTFIAYFVVSDVSSFLQTLIILLLLGLLFFLYHTFLRKPALRPILVSLILWAFFPALLSNLLGIYVPKYSLFALPALYILIGYAISHIENSTLRRAFFLVICFLHLGPLLALVSTPVYSAYKHTQYIEKHVTENSLVMTLPFQESLVLSRCFKGHSPVIGFYPSPDQMSLNERIVRHNWQSAPIDDEKLDALMKRYIASKNIVFYTTYQKKDDMIYDWFIKNGWTVQEGPVAGNYVSIYLFEFHAPENH